MEKMNVNEVEKKIKEILISDMELEISPDEIDSNEEYFLEKYNLNSVDALELLLKVEEVFDIEISDENLNSELIKTVNKLAVYVLTLM